MNTLRKVDDYFIGAGEGTVSDRVYFYGMYAMTGVIFLATVIAL